MAMTDGDQNGCSPLHLAVLEKNEALVNQLLDDGCRVDVVDKRRQTPLHLAVKHKFQKAVEMMLAKQSDLNAQDEDGNTLLHLAYKSTYWENDKGEDLDEMEAEDIMAVVAGRRCCNSLVKLLIDRGADLEIKNSKGETLLHLVILRNVTSICRLILDKNIDVNVEDENHRTPLLIAVMKEDYSVKLLLKKGALVNVKDASGNYPLHYAVITGDKYLVKLLLKNGADTGVKNSSGQNALHVAVKDPKCQSSLVYLLLESGVEINDKDNSGDTPLHLAVETRRNNDDDYWEAENILKMLLEWGANIDTRNNNGVTPLDRTANAQWRRIFTEHIVKVRAAKLTDDVQYQFDANFPEEYEEQCFEELDGMQVFKFGHHSLYKFFCNSDNPIFFLNDELTNIIPYFEHTFPNYDTLLRAKVFQAWQRKVLLCGAQRCLDLSPLPVGIIANILYFLSNNDLKNIIKSSEKNASYYLKLASDSKHNYFHLNGSCSVRKLRMFKSIKTCTIDDLKIYSTRLQQWPDLRAEVTQSHENILYYAVSKNFEEGVKALLESGIDINSKCCEGETPLHCAVMKNNATIAELLINNGADINSVNDYVQTPLHVAVSSRSFYMTEMLLEKGCDVNPKDKDDHTPLLSLFLYWSNEKYTAEICDLLITHGADTNVKDNTLRWSPFMYAVSGDCPASMCRLLLDAGANMDRDTKNRTPLHIVCNREKQSEEVCRLLLSRGAKVDATDIQGRTPLHLAAKRRKLKLLQILAAEGGDLSARDKKEQTVLHSAAEYNEDASCVRFLLESGVELNPIDVDGRTPIQVCLSTWYDCKPILMEFMNWGGPEILKHYGNMSYLTKQGNSPKWKCFFKCIIKLHCAKIIDTMPYFFRSTRIKLFEKECFLELKTMKTTVIGQNTWFDIISNYCDPSYVLNNEMEEALSSDKFQSDFPLYSSFLYVTFMKAKKRLALLNSAQEHFKIALPSETVRYILTFLSDGELKHFVDTLLL